MVRPLHLSLALRPDSVLFVGNVAYADAVHAVIPKSPRVTDPRLLRATVAAVQPELIVVAGWQHLIPADIVTRYTCVGFHSAKLPEYPGRAPVPWTLIRGDSHAWNTMLYLDAGIDSGDIIEARSTPVHPDDTPETLYAWIGDTSAAMLAKHLPALLEGTAPRTPQDPARRGPLTTRDGWQVLASSL